MRFGMTSNLNRGARLQVFIFLDILGGYIWFGFVFYPGHFALGLASETLALISAAALSPNYSYEYEPPWVHDVRLWASSARTERDSI